MWPRLLPPPVRLSDLLGFVYSTHLHEGFPGEHFINIEGAYTATVVSGLKCYARLGKRNIQRDKLYQDVCFFSITLIVKVSKKPIENSSFFINGDVPSKVFFNIFHT